MGSLPLRFLRGFALSLGLRHSACVGLLALTGLLASPDPATALPWHLGDVLTYTQVSWVDNATAAALLTDHYSNVYLSTSDVFEVGIPGPSGFSLSFGDASHVVAFLPQAGIAGPLTESQTNPGSSESGLFAGDVIALKLDVDYSDAGLLLGSSGIPFGDLVLSNFSKDFDGYTIAAVNLNGLSVSEFLGDVNIALGGGGSNIASISALDDILENVDIAFDGGIVTPFAQDHLMAPSRAVSAVPEPSSWVLFGTGLATLASTMRRRRHRTV